MEATKEIWVNWITQVRIDKIRMTEVKDTLKRMEMGQAAGPNEIPIKVWNCLVVWVYAGWQNFSIRS